MSPIPRFHETGKGSFFGDLAYERVVRRHSCHFLVMLGQMFDWEAKTAEFIRLYKGKGLIGRRPYEPVLIFKMLFLSYLYNVSERSMEELADLNMLVKWFLGIAVDEPAPDHSTLTAFKRRLLQDGGWKVLKDAFDEMIRDGVRLGVQFGELQVLDSVHTQANVDHAKDRERQEQGGKPRDPDAKVVHKGKRRVVEANGETTLKEMQYCGYKTHTSVNAQTGVVTSLIVTSGNAADNKAFPGLREQDRSLDLPTTTYTGDKAYDDTDIHERLEQEGLCSAIILKSERTGKRDASKQRWLEMLASPKYQAAVSQRFRVEQCYGIVKRWNGFGRCRYLGLAHYRLQALFTFLVHNVKRMVKLLSGVTFRPQAKGRRAEVLPTTRLHWAECAQ
jgi:IS5 family transposase